MISQPISRRSILLGAMGAVLMPSPSIAQQGSNPASQEPTNMKIKMAFNGLELTGTLYDNASARDFFSLLPLDISIESYANNEKIAYLPRALTLDGSGPFSNEQPGDICYFAPWGNLALFYAGYAYSSGLVRLGRFDDFEPLLTRGEFPLRIQAI